MTTHNLQSAVSRSIPSAGRPPWQLGASFWLWLLAVAAGLFETTLAVIDAAAGQVGFSPGVALGVGVRLLAFTGLVFLATRLRQGKLGPCRLGGAVRRARDPVAGRRGGPLARQWRIGDRCHGVRGSGLDTVCGQQTGAPGSDHRGADLDVPPGRKRLHPSDPAHRALANARRADVGVESKEVVGVVALFDLGEPRVRRWRVGACHDGRKPSNRPAPAPSRLPALGVGSG
jgi:hypothetical protein